MSHGTPELSADLAPTPTSEQKRQVREALDAVASLTIRELAAQLGVSVSFLYACVDPSRTSRLGADRTRLLSGALRQMAARLSAVADRLESTDSVPRAKAG